jgi:translation initiation factor 2B subunit (eIF-2B alpha/beta/delta family)
MDHSVEDEKKYWNWLDDEHSQKLVKIRKNVTSLFENNKRDLPFYTPHGIGHLSAVEDLIHKLIPLDTYIQLNMKERFFLLASAWLHDIGMLPEIAENVFPNLKGKPNEIRKMHHITSDKYIVQHFSELGIDESDKDAIGKLCRFHRRQENISECDKEVTVGHKDKIRLQLLAAYLRLADSLDITSSRVPANHYSICLTYGIPIDSKIHWIKSKLVIGTNINHKHHKILITFKEPCISVNMPDDGLNEVVHGKLRSIINLVLEDLRKELMSVMTVLINGGITFYLDIDHIISPFEIDRQMEFDLREMVLNFDILMAPSASKFLEMNLIAAANIIGYSLYVDNKGETQTYDFKKYDDHSNKLQEFIAYLSDGPLKSRSCHLGLRKFVNELSQDIKDNPNIPREDLAKLIKEYFKNHHNIRNTIRKNSRIFFKEEMTKLIDNNNEINILLYGYSELVAKALCGFRDSLIMDKYNDKSPDDLRSSLREYNYSKQFNIFICEGQPKTQSSSGDHLIYHDGAQYSMHLRRRCFSNIALIPDILAGHVIEKLGIDLIIVGANGINDQCFQHSAGHSSIINLAREYRSRIEKSNHKHYPYIVLVCSGEKYLQDKAQSNNICNYESELKISDLFESSRSDPYIIDGYAYLNHKSIITRESVWLLKDRDLLNLLCPDGSKRADKGKPLIQNTFLYNPREDTIPIENIDFLICEKGYSEINLNNYSKIINRLFTKGQQHKETISVYFNKDIPINTNQKEHDKTYKEKGYS